MAKTVDDVLKLKEKVKMVDLRFTDMPGTWQHFSIPARAAGCWLYSRMGSALTVRRSAASRKSTNRTCC